MAHSERFFLPCNIYFNRQKKQCQPRTTFLTSRTPHLTVKNKAPLKIGPNDCDISTIPAALVKEKEIKQEPIQKTQTWNKQVYWKNKKNINVGACRRLLPWMAGELQRPQLDKR